MKLSKLTILLCGLTSCAVQADHNIYYEAFTVNYNCDARTFNWVHFTTIEDFSDIDVGYNFQKDPNFTACQQQSSTSSYPKKLSRRVQFDRGHGVPKHILDYSKNAMLQSNYLTNVAPQHHELNRRGLWRTLENRVECARDITDVEVYAGNIFGSDKNDFFVSSHGVKTPDYLWRVHKYDDRVYAWLMPNSGKPHSTNEVTYRVSLKDLSWQLEYETPWPDDFESLETHGSDPFSNAKCDWS